MQNILPATFLHNNKSTKDCTQFLIESEDGCLSRFSFMVFNATLINIIERQKHTQEEDNTQFTGKYKAKSSK
jgi:hypothetical protein